MTEDDEIRITLRLPESVRDQLKAASDQSGRSMNAEIVARIADSFRGIIVTPDELHTIRAKQVETEDYVKKLTEALGASAARERELNERMLVLVSAMEKSNESYQRIMDLIEKQNVGQKA